MIRVDILETQPDTSQIVVAFYTLHQGHVQGHGDKTLVENIRRDGIRDYRHIAESRELPVLFPKDGEIFLEQLAYNFDTAYLRATKPYPSSESNNK